MPDFLLLMRDDAPEPVNQVAWGDYIAALRASGRFQGGSAIGPGACVRKMGEAPEITPALTGFIRVSAADLDDARALVAGNPVFEAGGTVEIRSLPPSD
jgi:hypothetical protein